MAQYIPDARLIAILRHPVDRAYSHFLMNRRRGCEPEADFRRAIQKEDERAERGWGWDWSYIGAGLYFEQLQRYYHTFSEKQIKIFLYRELKENIDIFFRDFFAFLEIDDSFRPVTTQRHRTAFIPRSYTLQALLRNTGPLMSLAKRLLPEQVPRQLREKVIALNADQPVPLLEEAKYELFERYFAEDCNKLESLIGHDLTTWKGPKKV